MKFKAYMIDEKGNKFDRVFTNYDKYVNFATFFRFKTKHIIECK